MGKFFLQGTCTRGSSCAFSHGDGDSSGKSAGKSAGKANGLGGFWSSQRGWEEDADLLEIQRFIDKAQGKANDDGQMMMTPAVLAILYRHLHQRLKLKKRNASCRKH